MVTKRLLIVDDEPKFAALVGKVAGPLGYDIEITTNGRQFMEAFLRERPHTIVLDMGMPEIDGYNLILWLVDQKSTADIIIVTGHALQYATEAHAVAKHNGLRSVHTLTKPVSVARLRQTLTATGIAPH